MKKQLYSFFILILIVIILSACGTVKDKKLNVKIYLLGTVVDISIYDSSDRELLDGCIDICREYETMFSRHMEGSELYNLNLEMAEDGEAEVSDELCSIIHNSLYFSEISEGAFDITIGAVSSLWDFVSGTTEIPDGKSIKEAIEHVSYSGVNIDGNVVKAPIGTVFDLGAIAKGYVADRLREYLEENGVESAIINLGGNVLCIGGNRDGEPFKIGIRKPFDETGETAALIKIKSLSAVTSGPYERYFVRDDKLYHHILNPHTGYPVENRLSSVTIISESSEIADAVSTASFVLGTEEAIRLIESLDNVHAMFILDNGQITCTEQFEKITQTVFS